MVKQIADANKAAKEDSANAKVDKALAKARASGEDATQFRQGTTPTHYLHYPSGSIDDGADSYQSPLQGLPLPSQQHNDASVKYILPRHLEEGEYLAQHCKEANTPLKNGSSAGKGSRRKKEPSMGDAHPWHCALMQTAANIEAMLLSGRFKYSKVYAPDVGASATPCPAASRA